MPLTANPTTAAFDSSMEHDLFYHALSFVRIDLGRTRSGAKFWGDYVLRLAYSVDWVQSAFIALAAAHKSFLMQQSLFNPSQAYTASSDGSLVLQQYNRAIRKVAAEMSIATPANIHPILVCCLIFITVENLRGCYSESLRHLRAGCRLLTLLSDSRGSLSWLSSKSTDTDLLTQEFQALAIDASIFYDIPTALHPEPFTNEMSSTLDLTQPFSDSAEATRHLQQIELKFNHYWDSMCEEDCNYSENPHDPIREQCCQSAERDCTVEEVMRFRAIGHLFDKWSARFDSFFITLDHRNMPSTDPNSHEALALALSQKLWQATFNDEPWINDGLKDAPEYEEMIALGEKLVGSSVSDYPYFRTDSRLISPLSFIGMFCKTTTRRKAIDLLRRIHWKEGVWDSQEVADILGAALDFEDEDGNHGENGIESQGTLELTRKLLCSGLLPMTKYNGIVELAKSRSVPLVIA